MRENRVDTIVLGCTHYPLVSQLIEEIMQREMTLIHTGEAIAKRLLVLSAERGHENEGDLTLSLYATSQIDEDIVANIMKGDHPITKITI
jgi:glutamate racemase